MNTGAVMNKDGSQMQNSLLTNSQKNVAALASRGWRQRIAAGSLAVLTLAAAPLADVSGMWLTAFVTSAQARSAPESFADLAEKVSSAVVNISVSQDVASTSGARPNIPRGTPFDELFEEFFRRRQQGETQPQAPRPPVPSPQRRSSSLGSGFVIDASGVIVTNNHVIAGATEITVIFTNGDRLKAEIVGRDAKVDLAVLRVKPKEPLKAVKFGDSNKLRVGDWVMAVGNPFGLGGSVTAGIVSARNRNINSGPYDDYLQTDAAINKGNSGGPLFNMEGEVIGVNTAIYSPTGGSVGIGFASPSATVMPVIDQLLKYGETRRGWLGVRIQSVDDAIAESLGLGKPRGALIAGVDDKGPSKAAGIRTGDVIVKFDDREVRNANDLPRIVANTPVGKEVSVVVMRKGKEEILKVTLGRLEDGEKQASLSKPEPGGSVVARALGMEFVPMDDAARQKYSLADTLEGVVISSVADGSVAAEKRLQAGEVIVEINQEKMRQPGDIVRKMRQVKEQGRRSALFQIANAKGEVRFVALPVE